MATRLRNEKITERFVETVLKQDCPSHAAPPTVTLPWLNALRDGSKEVGRKLGVLACRQNANSLRKQPPSVSEASRVSAAAGVLSAIGYYEGRLAESDIVLPSEEGPLLESVFAANLGGIESPEISDPTGAFQEILSSRAAAAKELKKAFEILNKEISVQALTTRPLLRPVKS